MSYNHQNSSLPSDPMLLDPTLTPVNKSLRRKAPLNWEDHPLVANATGTKRMRLSHACDFKVTMHVQEYNLRSLETECCLRTIRMCLEAKDAQLAAMRIANDVLLSEKSELIAAVASRDRDAASAARIRTRLSGKMVKTHGVTKKAGRKERTAQQTVKLLKRRQQEQTLRQQKQQKQLVAAKGAERFQSRLKSDALAAKDGIVRKARKHIANKDARIAELEAAIRDYQASTNSAEPGRMDVDEVTPQGPTTQQQPPPKSSSSPQAAMTDCNGLLTPPATGTRVSHSDEMEVDATPSRGSSRTAQGQTKPAGAKGVPTDSSSSNSTARTLAQGSGKTSPPPSKAAKFGGDATQGDCAMSDAPSPSSVAGSKDKASRPAANGPASASNSKVRTPLDMEGNTVMRDAPSSSPTGSRSNTTRRPAANGPSSASNDIVRNQLDTQGNARMSDAPPPSSAGTSGNTTLRPAANGSTSSSNGRGHNQAVASERANAQSTASVQAAVNGSQRANSSTRASGNQNAPHRPSPLSQEVSSSPARTVSTASFSSQTTPSSPFFSFSTKNASTPAPSSVSSGQNNSADTPAQTTAGAPKTLQMSVGSSQSKPGSFMPRRQ